MTIEGHSLKSKEVNKCGASTIIINPEEGLKLLNAIENDLVLLQAKNMVEVVWSNNRIVISGYRPSNHAQLYKKYLSRWGNIISRIMDRVLLIKYIIANAIM